MAQVSGANDKNFLALATLEFGKKLHSARGELVDLNIQLGLKKGINQCDHECAANMAF